MAPASTDAAPRGRPLTLIRCGDATDDYAFVLDEACLDEVLKKVPSGRKVAVVSVVGAFRTGKSFLLTLVLRYLREKGGRDWLEKGGTLSEGNANEGVNSQKDAFEWRGGRNRMTTGITVWSEPFEVSSNSGELLSVIILDTQGLFDNETPMGLTSCIFGLSTLMSSFQVYNVANRIQEDNLQQLALFTEYGRMALDAQRQARKEASSIKKDHALQRNEERRQELREKVKAARACDGTLDKVKQLEAELAKESVIEDDAFEEPPPPFQRLEFLVRDWTEFEESLSDTDMEQQMKTYLDEVMAARHANDLQFTREQITQCFVSIGCRLLPHPGFAVTSKKYDGSTTAIEPLFKRCVDRFMRSVFSDLEPKSINGAELTALELGNYVRAYAAMFSGGANRFPQARTMLEATAEANNRNARAKALESYCADLDSKCGAGPGVSYLEPREFRTVEKRARSDALCAFDAMATMGRKASILETRASLDLELSKARDRFRLMNDARNPFRNVEFYVLPMVVAAGSFVARRVTDFLCPNDETLLARTCDRAEDAFDHLYGGVVFLMLLFGVQRLVAMKKYLKVVGAGLLDGGVKRD